MSLLNDSFIPVIVDREERPDIDTIYMNYIQAVNSVGGWPINVFLTPELEPVFGGTYWPGPGVEQGSNDDDATDEVHLDFLVILQKMEQVWREQETRCRKEAQEILSQLQVFAAEGTLGAKSIDATASAATAATTTTATVPADVATATTAGASATMTNLGASRSTGLDPLHLDLDLDQLEEAFTHIAGAFDAVNGGFGEEPKFPTPARLSFLLDLRHFPDAVADVVGREEVRHAALIAMHTLRHIRDGGLRDHVGAGFARYSVTADWAMPHFEKMVADNALLLGVYLQAWNGPVGIHEGAKSEDEFLDVVIELGDYLTSPPIQLDDGGFASSEAADSFYRKGDRHMREGAYYLWTRREFDTVVGGDTSSEQHASSVAAAHWNVQEHGNIPRHHDPHDEFLNQNVLRVAKTVEELSRQFGIPVDEVKKIIASAKEKLLAYRARERVRPDTDGKVVVSYNGMVISALARTAAAIQTVDADRSAKYLAAATKAAEFIREKLWDADKKVLYRTFYEFRSETRGFADDYAFLIQGLLNLFEATFDEKWLEWADELQGKSSYDARCSRAKYANNAFLGVQIALFYDPFVSTTTTATDTATTTETASHSSSGGFYSTEESAPRTILRLKDGMDTALPSTNGVSASNLFRLGSLLGDAGYLGRACETISAFEVEMLQYPWLFLTLLSGVVSLRLGVPSRALLPDGRKRGWQWRGGEEVSQDVVGGDAKTEKAKVVGDGGVVVAEAK